MILRVEGKQMGRQEARWERSCPAQASVLLAPIRGPLSLQSLAGDQTGKGRPWELGPGGQGTSYRLPWVGIPVPT